MMMKIATNLPSEVHSFKYVKNSHWIELEDDEGHKARLFDNALMLYSCKGCNFNLLSPHNTGPIPCPLCRETMEQAWQKVQVCFVPDEESGFHMPQKEEQEE